MIKDNILQGPPLPAPFPTESTGWVLYNRLINFDGEDKVFVDEATGKYLTYRQFLSLACSCAQALRKSGLKEDEIVAICSENNVYFFVIIAACLFVGLPITAINPVYTETELNHALSVTHPVRIFCSKAAYPKVQNQKAKHDWIERIIVIDGDESITTGDSLTDFLTKTETIDTDVSNFSPTTLDSSTAVALIMFSSGTTGLPKGVMITHENINFRFPIFTDIRLWYQCQHPNTLGILPFFHSFGLQLALGEIYQNKTIHIMQRFDVTLFLKSIEKYRIETVIVVPAILAVLAKHPAVDQFDLSCVKDIGYGSASSNIEAAKMVAKRFGTSPRQAYGLTETTFSVVTTPPGSTKLETVGFVNPGLELCIVDPDTGKKLGQHEHGEICVKGSQVAKGYYKDEEATTEMFTDDGFLKTGDIGYYDDKEYVYVVDRIKDLIKYNAFQVAPAELEGILMAHPKIKQAAVVGLPDEIAGELPCAFVVKQPDTDLDEDEVKSYLAALLSSYKHLRGGVIFVDEIPVNSVGKVLRRELRKMLPKV